jgi:hypothetical protein
VDRPLLDTDRMTKELISGIITSDEVTLKPAAERSKAKD